jgi:hypothetical protein
LYSALAAVASIYDYPHLHEAFLYIPFIAGDIAMQSLSKAIEKLYLQDAVSQLIHIQNTKSAICVIT